MKFVSKIPFNNMQPLIQIMAPHWNSKDGNISRVCVFEYTLMHRYEIPKVFIFNRTTHTQINCGTGCDGSSNSMQYIPSSFHDDVIKWKHFTCYWPFVRGIHRSPVNSPYKGQWRGALVFSLICAWMRSWVNNREAGDLRRHHAHYDAIIMY